MSKDINLDNNLNRIDEDYKGISDFVERSNNITYSKFDSELLHRVNLFALPENFDFDGLNEALDVMIKTLPSMKRIFANPITHIKTTSEILPVESVKVINNDTIVHAASHSELWSNITQDGLKPRKLLTVENRDNYATYENLVFTKTVDNVLRFVSKNIGFLNSILYTDRDLTFNLLERENHLLYFLSIGKLHTGYVRDHLKYRTSAESCLEKALFIDRVLRSRLARPVYKNCRNHTGSLVLKKTNVFRMDKEYHKIYTLIKWMADSRIADLNESQDTSIGAWDGYRRFCTMLSIFAVGNFNFTFPESTLDFDKLQVTASYLKWNVKLETVGKGDLRAVSFTFTKDKQYRVLLMPVVNEEEGKEATKFFKMHYNADEYIPATPYNFGSSTVHLSLFDIESFRRIQQILLRGMIMCDEAHENCPFCGESLTPNGNAFECELCRTVIEKLVCDETKEPYFATSIKHFIPKAYEDSTSRRDQLRHDRQATEIMHYRNITLLGPDMEPVCPRCGKLSCGNRK